MKYFTSLFLLISLPGLWSCGLVFKARGTDAQQSKLRLKVISYNVHRCNPPSKVKSNTIEVEAVVAVLKKQNADFIFLQEIDSATQRSGNTLNQAEAIAKELGLYWVFGKAIDLQGGGYGVAILSKYPLRDKKVFLLPKSAAKNDEQRVLLTVAVTLTDGKEIKLACTHLDHLNDSVRVKQAEKINSLLKESKQPVVFAGDFNDKPESVVVKTFSSLFRFGCADCLPTFPNDHPVKTIDYIVTDHKTNWKLLSYTVPDEQYASDHRPVTTVLEL